MLDCEMQQLFEQSLDELEKSFVNKLVASSAPGSDTIESQSERMRITQIDL